MSDQLVECTNLGQTRPNSGEADADAVNPLISIVMPVYNSSKYLEEAIRSIQAQTYGNWELWAVDDCSKDDSLAILRRLAEADSRIQVFPLEKNVGPAVARNTGIERCDGRYLSFMDSDDLWHADKLEKELDFIHKNAYSFVFTAYDIIDEDGRKVGKEVWVPDKIDYKEHLYNNIIWTSTVMVDLDQIGKFQMPELRAGQDLATWLMLLKKVPYAYGLKECLASYRQVSGSISHSLKRRLSRTWNVYRKVEHLSVIKSAYLYLRHMICILTKRKSVKGEV